MEAIREQEYHPNTLPAVPRQPATKVDAEQNNTVDPIRIYHYKVTFKPKMSQLFTRYSRPEWFGYILQALAKTDYPDKDLIERYLRHMYRNMCKATTIYNTGNHIGYFLLYLKDNCNGSIKTITREDIESFVEHEQDRGLKPKTVRCKLMTVRAFIRFFIDQNELDPELLSRKLMVKLPDKLPRALDPQDLNLFLSGIDHVRDRAFILLLLRTGIRIGELRHTTVDDLNLQDKKILIHQAQKTGNGRVVYYSDDAAQALDEWLARRDNRKIYLFHGHRLMPLSYSRGRTIFMKYIKKAGLEKKGYTVHCLRHTFASELLNAGMHLECLQKLVGHTSIEVTRQYARLTDKTRENEYFKAMEKIERGDINGHY